MYALRTEDLQQATAIPIGAEALLPAAGEVQHLDEAALDSRSVHIGAAWATAAVYAVLLLVYWVTFGGSPSAAFMVAISTVYVAVFFAVPWFAVRSRDAFMNKGAPVSARRRTFSEFLDGQVDTANGGCSGREAMVQILTVPVCLLAATAAFAVIWAFV